MKITVRAKTNSKKESVEKAEDGTYVVRVNVPPIEGRANERIVELLSEHFDVPKRSIELVSGHQGRQKIFRIG